MAKVCGAEQSPDRTSRRIRRAAAPQGGGEGREIAAIGIGWSGLRDLNIAPSIGRRPQGRRDRDCLRYARNSIIKPLVVLTLRRKNWADQNDLKEGYKAMAFMVMSKRRPGVSRAQIIEHLTSGMYITNWDLIKNANIEQLFFIIGDEPGFFAVVNSDDIDEVKAKADEAISRHNLFDLEITPISRFPDFGR